MADMSGAALNVSMFLVILLRLLSFLMIIWFMFSMYTLSEFSPTKKARFFPQAPNIRFRCDISVFPNRRHKKAPLNGAFSFPVFRQLLFGTDAGDL